MDTGHVDGAYEDEAEIGAMILQVKEHQTVCKSPEARAEAGQILSSHLSEEPVLLTPGSQILTPELWKKFLFKPTSLWY